MGKLHLPLVRNSLEFRTAAGGPGEAAGAAGKEEKNDYRAFVNDPRELERARCFRHVKGPVGAEAARARTRDRASYRSPLADGEATSESREPERGELGPAISDRSYKTIVSFKYALKGEAMHQEIRGRWQAASSLSSDPRPPVPSALSIRAEDTRLESMGTTENRA